MGYAEAKRDGVRYESQKHSTAYFPLCHICGEEVMTLNYKSNLKYTCKQCKTKQLLSDKNKKVEQGYSEKEKKFDNAVKRISKKVPNLSRYEHAIKKVHEKLHTHGWFDSTEEIMVAIELVKNRIPARHQVRFGRYKADFVLPNEKVVLEVDGHVYHTERTKEHELIRDSLIILSLGAGWEVIRISDTLINQNITELLPAIRTVKAKREKIREKNDGLLPEWYTDKSI